MTAVDAADDKTLRDCISYDRYSKAQEPGLIAVVNCIVSQRAFERAIVQRWGADAVQPMAKLTTFSTADRASVQTARVERRDDREALVILAPRVSPIVVRLGSDGRWRVVLRAVRSLYDTPEGIGRNRSPRHPEPGSLKQIDYMEGVALTLQNITAAIRDGKFATADAARAALQKAVEIGAASAPAYDEAPDAPKE